MAIEIQEAKEDEYEDCVKLWNRERECLATSKRKISVETFEEWNAPGKRAGYTYYCVKYKNKFAGIFFVQENKKELLIKAIAIKKRYRKLGLGKHAVQMAMKLSKTKGMPLRTEVLLQNVDSINWFFKMGFFIIRYNEKTSDYLMEYRPRCAHLEKRREPLWTTQSVFNPQVVRIKNGRILDRPAGK